MREWAIVAGAGLNGLGVVRALGAGGVRVAVIDSAPGPAVHSGHTARTRIVRPHRGTPDFLRAVAALAAELGGRPALFLTQEATVFAATAHRELLAGIRLVLPDPSTANLLLSKERTHARAEEVGYPVPHSVVVAGQHEVALAAALTYPVVLKPVAKSEEWERRNKKGYRFTHAHDLARTYAEVGRGGPPVIVQEWIEGDDSDVYFTLSYRDAAGRRLGSFTGRKLRQWPPAVGGTASCAPADSVVAAELDELTERFLTAVGCVGMASLEYKRDRRTGRFVIVEPTVGRTDFQSEVATPNVVKLPLMAYASLVGSLAPPPRPARASIWRERIADARSAEAQPALALPPETAAMRIVDALARTDDPGPFLAERWAALRRRLRI